MEAEVYHQIVLVVAEVETGDHNVVLLAYAVFEDPPDYLDVGNDEQRPMFLNSPLVICQIDRHPL